MSLAFHSSFRTGGALIALALAGSGSVAAQADGPSSRPWTAISDAELLAQRAAAAKPWVRPDVFQAARLDPDALALELESGTATVPTPGGGYERFALEPSPVMHPELAAWLAGQGWPMQTFGGASLDRPGATVRLDWGGPAGFHAMVLAPGATYFVDPYWQGDDRLYVSYFKRDYRPTGKAFSCEFVDESATRFDPSSRLPISQFGIGPARPRAASGTGGMLRTYRLANAATAEYTAFHGGTVAAGLAAIVTTMNRVNGVYVRDLSLFMQLVPNNNQVVYTMNPDPYTSGNCFMMLNENQSNLNAVIGLANYDIGHVFDLGGGGVAQLAVPCGSSRARGCTGISMPIGDPFDIDYVAHEMGHQWGASHTFNGSLGSCANNRTASRAYEPGSGSTIMAYAGICGADDLQPHSDDNFHGTSLDQIEPFVSGGGSSCVVLSSANNPNAPTVSAGPDFTIPMGTPFELTALSGSDLDGHALTYDWEEFDLGPQAPLSAGDNGSSPIFRDWPATASPTRVFPRLTDLLSNTTAPGETLPVTNRSMTYRVTVRDNAPGGGRIGKDQMILTSTTSSGPFTVTAPGGGGGACPSTVTWNVADTSSAPVSAALVDILLSGDGGLTFPITLAAATPNDGSQAITLPGVGPAARIKIRGTGKVFFDLSNANCTTPFRGLVSGPGAGGIDRARRFGGGF